MCTTCGCGRTKCKIDGDERPDMAHASRTARGTPFARPRSLPRSSARPRHPHDHDDHDARPCAALRRHRRPHARLGARASSRSSATSWRRTTPRPRPTAGASPTHGIFALNLVSSPGSGKTTLLVRDHRGLQGEPRGRGDRGRPADLERRRPHPRHRRAGGADQHRQGLPPRRRTWSATRSSTSSPPTSSVLMIENVGNLVCPAALRPGRGAQGGGALGDRGRGQAAQVSRHVRRRRPDGAEQVRPAAAPRLRRRRLASRTRGA